MTETELEQLPTLLLLGIDEYNQRRFAHAGEILGRFWLTTDGEVRNLTRGLAQVAAGFDKLTRRQQRGAASLLGTGLNLLRPYPPVWNGIEVGAFVRSADRCLRQVVALGEARIGEFDLEEIPEIDYQLPKPVRRRNRPASD